MLEKVSYEHLLAKLNNNTENFKKSWDCSRTTGTIRFMNGMVSADLAALRLRFVIPLVVIKQIKT